MLLYDGLAIPPGMQASTALMFQMLRVFATHRTWFPSFASCHWTRAASAVGASVNSVIGPTAQA
eukprot:2584778-Lingulodinium_polyedra.AAC.1